MGSVGGAAAECGSGGCRLIVTPVGDSTCWISEPKCTGLGCFEWLSENVNILGILGILYLTGQ